jgi:hypothetical protein
MRPRPFSPVQPVKAVPPGLAVQYTNPGAHLLHEPMALTRLWLRWGSRPWKSKARNNAFELCGNHVRINASSLPFALLGV